MFYYWWPRIILSHRENDREHKGAKTRKSDELNKRPDGLSETVAVRNMNKGSGGGKNRGENEVGKEGDEDKKPD